mmetsp:Transcript_31095/g.60034  ORF Transcript_31095/g.60034 Transcript_31095/m.60034 type:complete len:1094 (+) Transcript_31095:912-4193(+)
MRLAKEGIEKCQRGILRYNCADSLDRTNLAGFFCSVQILVEQCRCIGVFIENGHHICHSRLRGDRESAFANEKILPTGWESRVDAVTGHIFYIDHNTRTTTWTHPVPYELESVRHSEFPARPNNNSFGMLGCSVDDIRRCLMTNSLAALADLFLMNGDIHAGLYTGSKAMHTSMMHLLDSTKKRSTGVASNLSISLQRRYLNMMQDSGRQLQIEIFLGLNISRDFPSVPVNIKQRVLSQGQYGLLLRSVPSLCPSLLPEAWMLGCTNGCAATAWLCPNGENVVELCIFLERPCRVHKLLLTIAHGTYDVTAPLHMDVKVGRYINTVQYVLKRVCVPRCESGSRLLYYIPPIYKKTHSTEINNEIWEGLDPFRFNQDMPEVDYLTRIVTIRLHASAGQIEPMSLGPVQILGESLVHGCSWETETSKELIREFVSMNTGDSLICAIGQDSESAALGRDDEREAETRNCALQTINVVPNDINPVNHLAKFCTQRLTAETTFEKTANIRGSAYAHGMSSSLGLSDMVVKIPKERPLLNGLMDAVADSVGLATTVSGEARPTATLEVRHPAGTYEEALSEQLRQTRLNAENIVAVNAASTAIRTLQKLCPRMPKALSLVDQHTGFLLRCSSTTSSASFVEGGPSNCEAEQLDQQHLHQDERQPVFICMSSDMVSLAMFPYAGLAASVPTAENSPPPEAILANPAQTVDEWFAPEGVDSVEFVVVLPVLSRVQEVRIQVGAQGYSAIDAPVVNISTGDNLSTLDDHGSWDTNTSSNSIPESTKQAEAPTASTKGRLFPTLAQAAALASDQWLVCKFASSMVCRVVSVRVELPLRDQSASICAHKQDENDSDETDWISVTESDAAIAPTPHEGLSKEEHSNKPVHPSPWCQTTVPLPTRHLHLLRLVVVGSVVGPQAWRPELERYSERLMYKRSMADPRALPSRCWVHPSWEEVRGGGHVLELGLPVNVPWISGFRIYAPPQQQFMSQQCNPLVIRVYIQAEALKIGMAARHASNHCSMPTFFREYTIPVVREGTSLFFDFPQILVGTAFTFQLSGPTPPLAMPVPTHSTLPMDAVDSSESVSVTLLGRLRLYRYINTMP